MWALFSTLFYFLNIFIIYYVLIINVFYLVLFVFSIKQINFYLKRMPYSEYEEISLSSHIPPISIVVPAFNEEKTIIDNIYSLLQLTYSEYEIIVVNDGSEDGTLHHMINRFHMIELPAYPIQDKIDTNAILAVYRSIDYPSLLLVDKLNGGKADALNAGINVSNYPYFCSVDADSLLEPNSLSKAMAPFFEDGEDVVACGGIVRIANGCHIKAGYIRGVGLPKNLLALHQVIEYLRSFLVGRLGLSKLNNLLIISGAFGIFRKKEILEIGGYATDTVGEDMEIIVRLQKFLSETKRNGKVLFVPDPVCWTEAPETFRELFNQRTRWHLGLLETMIKHKSLVFNPAYKSMGLFAMPYFLLVELLGPIIELVGTIFILVGLYLGIVNIPFAILFFSATLIYGVFLSIGAILLEEYSFRRYPRVTDLLKLFIVSIIENFWYRQMNSIFRIWAFVRFFKRDTSWGLLTRKGFGENQSEKTRAM